MNPLPTTTTRLPSLAATIASASSLVRSRNASARSKPGRSGRTGSAPVDRTRASYVELGPVGEGDDALGEVERGGGHAEVGLDVVLGVPVGRAAAAGRSACLPPDR